MGERPMIPLSDAIKTKTDVAAVSTAFAAWFKAIPWPELAACAALIYTSLRIAEMVYGWFRKRRHK